MKALQSTSNVSKWQSRLQNTKRSKQDEACKTRVRSLNTAIKDARVRRGKQWLHLSVTWKLCGAAARRGENASRGTCASRAQVVGTAQHQRSKTACEAHDESSQIAFCPLKLWGHYYSKKLHLAGRRITRVNAITNKMIDHGNSCIFEQQCVRISMS